MSTTFTDGGVTYTIRDDGSLLVTGSNGGDTISGHVDLNDNIHGEGGDDVLAGSGGDDILNGGAGNDTLIGASGNDSLSGGLGDDLLRGDDGDDTIVDTLGVDVIFGGAGNDNITVTGGDAFRFDRVDAGSGNDTILSVGRKVIVNAGSGNDTITTDLAPETFMVGGAGSDRFVVTGVHTGDGRVAELHGGDALITTSNVFGLESIDNVTAGTDTSIDTLDLSQFSGFGDISVNLSLGTLKDQDGVLLANMTGIENVVGSATRDLVTGSGGANEMHGGGGNDVLNGEGGDDTLFGDAGTDSLSGGLGNDMLNGGAENDSLLGNAGNDVLFGDAGNDALNGGAGGDVLVGGTGNDTLNGSTGADVLYGDFYGDAVSRDTLTGGADADRFVFVDVGKIVGPTGRVTFLNDRITDFDVSGSDHDTIDLSPLVFESFADSGLQQAMSQGFVYFVQHGTQGQAGFGTTVRVDFNGGTHSDSANNFVVVDLDGVRAADLSASLFLV